MSFLAFRSVMGHLKDKSGDALCFSLKKFKLTMLHYKKSSVTPFKRWALYCSSSPASLQHIESRFGFVVLSKAIIQASSTSSLTEFNTSFEVCAMLESKGRQSGSMEAGQWFTSSLLFRQKKDLFVRWGKDMLSSWTSHEIQPVGVPLVKAWERLWLWLYVK